MSVFDAIDYYPTPSRIIAKMISPHVPSINNVKLSILEPSCGNGNILKYISDNCNVYKNKLYAFELNQELSLIASNIDGIKMLGDDFLQYNGGIYFNLILMNPPFSAGDKHLLHAWNILHEGDIVCLLNEETIKNPFSTNRKMLVDLIEKHGTVEYLGNCFSDAQRKTNVGVALVRLKKNATDNPFDFEKLGLDGEGKVFSFDFSSNQNNAIATNDVIGNTLLCFEQLTLSFGEIIKSINKAAFYGKSIGFNVFDVLGGLLKNMSHLFNDSRLKINPYTLFNELVSDANHAAWDVIFNATKFGEKLTTDFRYKFERFRKSKGGAAFTKKNIMQLLEFIMENQSNIIHQGIVSVFDRLTKYSEKNLQPHLRWKTNSHYKLNRKFIMPDCGKWNNLYNYMSLSFNGLFRDWSHDLDTCCTQLTGEKIVLGTNDCLYYAVEQFARNKDFSSKGESKFFMFKIYKKGTVHVEFKDEELWHKFNITAAEGKNWLVDDLDKKGSKKK